MSIDLDDYNKSLLHDPQVFDLFAKCSRSTKLTAKHIFADRFELPFSDLHDQIFKVLDDDSLQKVVIAAPRGFGKTTIDTIAYPAKKILFREKKFIVPVSATATKAEMDAENLKSELVQNPMVQEVFGPMKSDKFSKTQWVTESGTCVMPRGAGQQVRGILFQRYRPDLIVVDDLEDAEGVMSEDQRKKLKDWFFDDLCNSVNRSRKDWKIVVVGTVLHEDSLLVNLLEDPDWHKVHLSICDDDGKSNWPDFMSDEDVAELKASYHRRGQLDNFYREYRNIPISTEDSTFQPGYFKYYEEPITIEVLDKDQKVIGKKANKNIENVVILDPAKTVKIHSAESAIVGVGIDKADHRLYVRDIVSGKMYPDEIYDACFGMVERLKAPILGIEVTSLNEFITQPLKNEMMIRRIFPRLIELKARAKKEDRVAGLVPYYRQGYVYHNKTNCNKLESQLLAFPRSKYWDIMDALAYVIELMEMNLDYFDIIGEIDYSMDEEDYASLDNAKPLNNWRFTDRLGI